MKFHDSTKKQQGKNTTVAVLLSGGIDSTALVEYYLSKGYNVCGIHYQYGQASRDKEQQASENVSHYYGIQTRVVQLGFALKQSNGEFAGRNALFIIGALSCVPEGCSKIAIGIHLGSLFYDCTEQFINNCQSILDGYFGGTVILESPLVAYTKRQVYEYSIENGIPFHLTYSCETSNQEPCGTCPSCKGRMMLGELTAQ